MRQLTKTTLRLLTTLLLLMPLAPRSVCAQTETRMRIGQGIEPPRKIVHVSPVYPALAQAAGVQGVVVLEATIDGQGHVANARVLRSIPLLDQAAIDAVRQWQYVPTTLNGVPIAVIMTVTVNFTLAGSPAPSSAPLPTIAPPARGTVPEAPHSVIEPPKPLPSPMSPARPNPVFVGDVDLMKSYHEMMQTLQKETNGDPELQQALRNLQRMIEANGGNGSPPFSPSAPGSRNADAPPLCVSPSYRVSPLRWERFPLRVYIEEIELTRRGYSDQRRAEIVRLILQGLGSWAQATSDRIGSVTRVADFRGADVNVVFRNGAGNTIHDATQAAVIRHATILWDVDRWEAFADRDHRIVNGLAHEMGHVLGIVGHPATPNTLMADAPEQLTFEGPQPDDVAAILAKYGICK